MNEPNANDLGEDEICEGLFGPDSDDDDGTDNAPDREGSVDGAAPGAETEMDQAVESTKREREDDEPGEESAKRQRQKEQLSALIAMKARLDNMNKVMQKPDVKKILEDLSKLPEFQMPRNLLSQIYEFTGSTEENKGFMLVFVDQNGAPQIMTQASSQILEMGLRKATEEYLVEYSEMIKPDIDRGEQE